MPRKPNYGFERAERARVKALKKAERLKVKQERSAPKPADPAPDEANPTPPSD
jgi:hypothetical protein